MRASSGSYPIPRIARSPRLRASSTLKWTRPAGIRGLLSGLFRNEQLDRRAVGNGGVGGDAGLVRDIELVESVDQDFCSVGGARVTDKDADPHRRSLQQIHRRLRAIGVPTAGFQDTN